MTEGAIITRAEATAQGLKRYFTGKPCKHGHICERRICDYTCVACAQIARPSIDRRYYANHCEKRRDYAKCYHAANREELLKRRRIRDQKVSDMIAALKKEAPELLKDFGL